MCFAGCRDQPRTCPNGHGLSSCPRRATSTMPISVLLYPTAPWLAMDPSEPPALCTGLRAKVCRQRGDGLGPSIGQGRQSEGLVPLSPAGCSLSWPRCTPGSAQRAAGSAEALAPQALAPVPAMRFRCRWGPAPCPAGSEGRAALQPLTSAAALQASVLEKQPSLGPGCFGDRAGLGGQGREARGRQACQGLGLFLRLNCGPLRSARVGARCFVCNSKPAKPQWVPESQSKNSPPGTLQCQRGGSGLGTASPLPPHGWRPPAPR